jgi:hypothetical protein
MDRAGKGPEIRKEKSLTDWNPSGLTFNDGVVKKSPIIPRHLKPNFLK